MTLTETRKRLRALQEARLAAWARTGAITGWFDRPEDAVEILLASGESPAQASQSARTGGTI